MFGTMLRGLVAVSVVVTSQTAAAQTSPRRFVEAAPVDRVEQFDLESSLIRRAQLNSRKIHQGRSTADHQPVGHARESCR